MITWRDVGRGALWPVRAVKRRVQRLVYRWYTTRRLAGDGFDRIHGTDTARLVDTHAPNGDPVYRYETAGVAAIRDALDSLTIDLSDFTFVDLGCGMGRPLIIAAGYPFRRMIGVDISSTCIAGAARNLAACGLSNRAELLLGDAEGFSFPHEPLVLYLFNPFPEAVMKRVVVGLEQRVRTCPHRVAVVYMHPVHEDLVAGSGLFEKVADVSGRAARHERAVVFLSRVAPPDGG